MKKLDMINHVPVKITTEVFFNQIVSHKIRLTMITLKCASPC